MCTTDRSELLLDLVFVTLIARLGESLRGDDDSRPMLFLDYLTMFTLAYQMSVATELSVLDAAKSSVSTATAASAPCPSA